MYGTSTTQGDKEGFEEKEGVFPPFLSNETKIVSVEPEASKRNLKE